MDRVRHRHGVGQPRYRGGAGPVGRRRRGRGPRGHRGRPPRVRHVAVVPGPQPAPPGPERDGRPVRRPRRRTRRAGDQGERQDTRPRHVRVGHCRRHPTAQCGPGPDRHRHLGRGRAGAVVQHLRRAGRRRRHHRALERPCRPVHPVPRSRPVRGEHRRGQCRPDRARRQSDVADHRRGHLAAPRRGQHLHRIRQHGRPLPGRLTRCPGHQLHRQHRGRAHRRRERRPHPQADEPGARRQDADDRVRRRGPRYHCAAARRRRHDLRRAVLHDRLADPGPARGGR